MRLSRKKNKDYLTKFDPIWPKLDIFGGRLREVHLYLVNNNKLVFCLSNL